MTVFERCVERVRAVLGKEIIFDPGNDDPLYDPGDVMIEGYTNLNLITTAVLTALAEHTESPRTVDEVMRVLGEVG